MGKSDSVYKYTRLVYVNNSLCNGIFASPINSLNDPYESKDMEDKHFLSNYRVVCLSRSRNKKLMWSHYADGHRGCQIKIALPPDYGQEDCPLKRVNYQSKVFPHSDLTEKEIINSLYIKDKKWDYELEVRAVYSKDCYLKKYWKKYRNDIFFKVDITQIDFGCFSHFDSHYLDALIAIRDYNSNHKQKIKVRKYKMSDKKYQFILDNDFDYINEIERIISPNEF